MSNEKVVTRFAPSPTGYLHVGGARTALFNWLYARHNGGKFILRIEDTDRARSTEEATNAILDGLKWLGMDWDEGPFFQSARMDLYKEHVEKLLREGKAYRCICTPEVLETKRKEALAKGLPPKYDGACRNRKDIAGDAPAAVRFRMPEAGSIEFKDLIKGPTSFENVNIGDLVIARTDMTPTYNLTVVVDDASMGITHVIRGDDHVSNTPKQIQMYRALGYEVPRFAHVPMILGEDRGRLSKRHGATSVLAYRDMGYLADAFLNYLVRLGWACGDKEIFTKDEMIELFTLESVGKSPAVFDDEKLDWLNGTYIRSKSDEVISDMLMPVLIERGYEPEGKEWLVRVVKSLKERSKTLVDMVDAGKFFFEKSVSYDPAAKKKFLTGESIEYLKELILLLKDRQNFTEESVKNVFEKILEEKKLKLVKVAQPARVAITGGTVSPPIFETMSIMGKAKTIERLELAVQSEGNG